MREALLTRDYLFELSPVNKSPIYVRNRSWGFKGDFGSKIQLIAPLCTLCCSLLFEVIKVGILTKLHTFNLQEKLKSSNNLRLWLMSI